MSNKSPEQVYQDLLAVGFTPAAAVTMTEIGEAESGLNDAAVGDVSLESGTWGPSFGLFQIRTSKPATGTGTARDINALTGDDLTQARAAYQISAGGTNFGAWSTWTSGKYQQFAAAVTKALGVSSSNATPSPVVPADNGTGAPGPLPTLGPSWLPWNWPSDVGNSAAAAAQSEVSSIRTVAVEGLFAAAGLGLVAVGVIGLTGVRRKVNAAAGKVAKAAVLV